MYLQKHCNQLGITLIEMLISMTLLSLILSMLGGTFFQTDEFSKKTEKKIEYRKKIRNLKTILYRDITNAIFLDNLAFRSKPGDPVFDTGIIGKRRPEESPRLDQIFMHVNNLSLYHTELEPYRDPEIHEVGYFLGKTDFSRVYKLYRREDYYVDKKFDIPDENPYQSSTYLDTNKSITHFLVKDILSFELQYLDGNGLLFDPENPDKGWVDTWKSNDRPIDGRIPYAVRVTLKFPLLSTEEIDQMTEFNLNDDSYIETETFDIVLRWKLDKGFKWAL